MNINDLKEMCVKDTAIDVTDLDGYSVSIPELSNKYHQLAYTEKNILRFLQSEYKIIKLARWKYYSGKADPKEYEDEPFDLKVLKNDMDMFLDGDAQIITIKNKIDEQEEKIKLINETAKVIQNASFNISNTIKWKKFLAGDLT
ncbi:MAG: recombination mediator protein UvsY [Candidatus Pacebacteria bacterium]|nr:recombination mediator protein UvsY [Candidatus Paceibacterota bacterium]